MVVVGEVGGGINIQLSSNHHAQTVKGETHSYAFIHYIYVHG